MRIAPAVAVLAFTLLLSGCSVLDEIDPLDAYQGGREVEAVGVIRAPVSSQGDFVPGVLRVRMGFPVSTAQFESVFSARVPGIDAVALEGEPGSFFEVRIPPGVSLLAAQQAFTQETGVIEVDVRVVEGSAGGAMLVSTSTGGFLADAPRVTRLVVEDPSLVRDHLGRDLVRVQGRLPAQVDAVTPGGFLRVDALQTLGPHTLTMEGTFAVVGSGASACLLLLRAPGEDPLELVGATARSMASGGASRGESVRVRGHDLGLAIDACSGGRVFEVTAFEVL